METTCPRCGGPARRETDTLDCHFDALWLWVPVCVPPEARGEALEEILALPDLRHWLPSERVVAGSDSGNFVFDQRIVTKALRDIGPLAFLADGEPFAGCLFHEMVISDGRKMSKHLGNVVDPDELVERYGADTVRLAVLYAARPQRSLNWSDSAVLRCHRFLTQVWEYSQAKLAAGAAPSRAVRAGDGAGEDGRAAQGHDRAPPGETALAVVRDGRREDHRGHGEPRDAQRRAQRDAPVRPHQGLREARARAPGRAQPGRPRRAARGARAARASCSARCAPHLAEELWIAFGHDERPHKRRGRAYRSRYPHEHPDRTEPQRGAPGSGRARARPASSATAARTSYPLESTVFACPDCGKGLDVVYDYELAARHFKDVPGSERPQNIWHFEELLPIVDASAQARVGRYAGYTPLIRADRLGAELGLSNLYLKDDSTSRPSLSYKDRVVSMSVARLLELGKEEIGCVSTGNVGTAVASLAAKAGVDAYVFYPNRLEDTKARACMALGAKVCQVEGNYDEANRRCREVAEATGMDFANITLRPFYAEGAKTAAFEIVEQLDWDAPDHIVTAAAGGTLSSRLHKGLGELQLLGLSETDAHPHPHRPAQRLQPDRQRDPRRGGRDPPGDARRRPRTRWRSAHPATATW